MLGLGVEFEPCGDRPEILILTRKPFSGRTTDRPRRPASMAHIIPAAPAPMIRTSTQRLESVTLQTPIDDQSPSEIVPTTLHRG